MLTNETQATIEAESLWSSIAESAASAQRSDDEAFECGITIGAIRIKAPFPEPKRGLAYIRLIL